MQDDQPLSPNTERGTAVDVLVEALTAVLDQVDPMVPIDEACAAVACGPIKLRSMLADGELPGLKIGKEWVIPRRAFFERLNDMAAAARVERATQHAAKPNGSHLAGLYLPARKETRGRPTTRRTVTEDKLDNIAQSGR